VPQVLPEDNRRFHGILAGKRKGLPAIAGKKNPLLGDTQMEVLNLLDGQIVSQHKGIFFKLVKAIEEKTSTHLKPLSSTKDKTERRPNVSTHAHPWSD
jgi:hypothetical protein